MPNMDPMADIDGNRLDTPPKGLGGSVMRLAPLPEPTHTILRDPHQEPPEWLRQYMSTQPKTDPYHVTPPTKVDIINSNKYMNEREKLKMIMELRSQGKL